MMFKRPRDALRQRDGARFAALGQREYLPSGNELDLSDDVNHARDEVDVVDREAQHFALSHAAPAAKSTMAR